MADAPIHVRFETLADLRGQLLRLGIALDNASGDALAPAGAHLTSGAGELAPDLGDSVEQMTTSWSMFLAAVSDDASILGNTVGTTSVAFHDVDAAAGLPHDVRL